MACRAKFVISRNSCWRVAKAWLLIFAGTGSSTVCLGGLDLRPSHRHKVVSDDAPAHVSFKSNRALVKCPPHSKAMLKCAHPGFNARSPALAASEPALFLSFGASGA